MKLKLDGRPVTDLMVSMMSKRAAKEDLVTSHTEILKKVNDEISQYRDEIVRQIEAGGTTGDSLRDILLVHLSTWDEEREQKFREFQDKLAGKQGQLILIAFTGYTRTRFGGPHSDEGYQPEKRIRLGMLKGEKLVYLDNTIGISVPVKSYIEVDEWFEVRPYGGKLLKLVEENIFDHSIRGVNPPLLASHILGHSSLYSMSRHSHPDPSLDEVVVGDEEVNARVLKWPKGPEFYDKSAKLFGKLPAIPFELKPLSENDGPLPKRNEPPSSSEMNALCEVPDP